jgi:hypothetical protein
LWIFLRLGTFLELFFNSRGLFVKLWTAGQFQRNRGAFLQNSRNNRFSDLIFNGKFCGPSPRCGGPRTDGAAVRHRRVAREHWSSPVLAGDGGGRMSRSRWCSPVTAEWQRGGAPEAANGGGLSSSRGRRRAQRSSRERG